MIKPQTSQITMKLAQSAYMLFIAALCASASAAPVPASAQNVNPVEVGSMAPEATVKRPDGTSVSLSSLTENTPSVVVFYRGGWCPYCNTQLSALAMAREQIEALGYQVLAFSADSPAKVTEAMEANDYNYHLFSDASLNAAKAFGVAFQVDDATYQRLLGYGINLEKASGKEHHLLPVPAVFIVDAEGTITFRYFNPDYKQRLSTEALLEAIQ